jgi:hypothetical protein
VTSRDVVDKVVEDLSSFTAGAAQSDDVTMLVIRRSVVRKMQALLSGITVAGSKKSA